MDFRILGPLEVWSEAGQLDAGPPRQRGVLAALAVDAARPVPPETIADRVWGEARPDGVRRTLHVYITRLRQLLAKTGSAGAPPARLLRRSSGYVLDVEPDRVDASRFRRLAEQARDCDDAEKVVLLRQALDLWRGPALADLSGEWAERIREGWGRERLDAAVCWAQAELRLGNPSAVISELTDLSAEYPFVESLVAVQMRALYAAGYGAQALDVYARTRLRLVEELGTDPGPDLQALHQAILRGDLDQPAAPPVTVAAPAPPAAEVPAQLPLDVRGFAGRCDELARLDATLPAPGRPATTVVITAVSGTAGVGKTALAVHWAHGVADRFPDGQLYVNLRGYDPTGAALSPSQALRGFLDAFGVPAPRVPAGLEAQAGLFRSLLAGKRVLLVLDNARDAEQVRPLLPGAPGCLVVVTSRDQLLGLVANECAEPLRLDLLTPVEARQLLVGRLGPARVRAEPEAVEEILAHCARLPLALAIVVARAATHPGSSLAVLAGELRAAHHRLDAFDGGDTATDVRAVFSWSYQALSPAAARLFRLLGLHPGPDLGACAAASLAGVPVREASTLLTELARAHLVTEPVPGRFTFHDLLRAYAVELTESTDSDDDRRTAVHRMLDHYAHTGFAAAVQMYPHREKITFGDPLPGVTQEPVADADAAMAWFAGEYAGLLAAVDLAVRDGFDRHVCQLGWTLATFFDRHARWRDHIAVYRAAIDAAERLGDSAELARAHNGLGRAYGYLGHHDEALGHFRPAGDLYRALGDHAGEANVHTNCSWVLDLQGRHRDALGHAEQALAQYRAAGHRIGQARALNMVGWYLTQLGDHRQALARCRQALSLFQEVGDRHGQAATWDSLAYTHHHLGDYVRAVTCYDRALELFTELGDRFNEADVTNRTADTYDAAGDLHAARDAYRRALAIFEDLGHAHAEQVRGKLRRVERALAQPATRVAN